MKKKLFFLLGTIFFVVGLFFLKNNKKSVVKQIEINNEEYNLVVISIDTLSADWLSLYGFSEETTPNIDKWAKDAFVFTNAHTVLPMTYPSMAAFFTGIHPVTSGINYNFTKTSGDRSRLSDNVITLAEILRDNGYQTLSFNGNAVLDDRITNLHQGFNEKLTTYDYSGSEQISSFNNFMINISFEENSQKLFLDWLSKNYNQKIFAWIHIFDPHYPYDPPLSSVDDIKCCSEAWDYYEDGDWEYWESIRNKNSGFKNPLPDEEIVESMKKIYSAEVAYVDLAVKEIFDKIDELDLDKNTIVVLTSDHGEGFDHNCYFQHGIALYESGVNIPLIIKHPKFKPKRNKIDSLVDNTDFMPSVLDILGISRDQYLLTGNSFACELNGGCLNNKKFSYLTALLSKDKYAIVDGQYKYIYSDNYFWNNYREELYDYVNDPKELNNIIDKEMEKKNELKEQLFKFLSLYNLPINKIKSSEYENNVEILDKIESLGYH